ncbi:deoxyribonuclease-1-like [Lytechinus pictus]|uniref:deoxyribonuclease-1-like n=1 Tax=Lytechinus pictus TaxID=7653 RepID=UPI00240DCAE1|nr:deoxyribonuclease-1-like [Lytechinus pictus]
MESSVLPCSASIFRFDVEYNLTQEQVEIVCDHYPIEVSILPSQFKYSDPSLSIAAFNIQIFGVTKSGKDNVMDILAKILNRYDLILIQEIRDSRTNEPAVKELQDLVNRNNEDPFLYVISERLGRSSSKEQYAYFYRPSKLELVTSYVFEETQGDVFQREPYIAYFKSPTTYVKEFIIGGIHTQPDEAVAEIDNLVDVYSAIQEKYEVEVKI